MHVHGSRGIRTLVCLSMLTATAAAGAAGLGTRNESALARYALLPALGARAAAPGKVSWRFSIELASEFVRDRAGSEQILLDGETQAYSLSISRSWKTDWGWQITLPLLHTGSGFLDSHIDGWHEFFGLSDGGRGTAPQDRYRFAYARDGQTLLDLEQGTKGPGDIELGVFRTLGDSSLMRAAIDLPTGDEDQLTGGSAGGAVWLDHVIAFAEGSRLRGYLSAGVSANQTVGPLEDLQRPLVPFGGAGLAVRTFGQLDWVANLYLHGSLYQDSELDPLDRPGMPLAIALRWCRTALGCWELGFQEDLAVSASPDFTLRLAYHHR